MLGGGQNPAVLSRRDGADDEGSRRAIEGDGEEDHVVGSGGDPGGDRSDDAPLAGANGGRRVRRLGGPAQRKTECSTDSAGGGRGGAEALQGDVLRPEHPPLPRKVARVARD